MLANSFAIVLKVTVVEDVNSTLTNANLILANMEVHAVTHSTITLVLAPKVTTAVIARYDFLISILNNIYLIDSLFLCLA